MTGIDELISRLEKADAGSRELDFWLSVRVFDPSHHSDEELQDDIDIVGIDEMWVDAPFTSSIDAALSLAEKVCPGWRISMFIGHLTSAKDGSGVRASLQSPHKGRRCHSTGMRWPAVTAECFHATTAPLALCIATLRALKKAGQP